MYPEASSAAGQENAPGGTSAASTEQAGTDANQAGVSSPSAETQDAKPQGEVAEPSLLDVVKAAAKGEEPGAKPDAGASSDPGGKKDQATAEKPGAEAAGAKSPDKGDGTEDADGEGDDEKPPPFHEHPAWKRIVRERDTYRTDAERYGNVLGFMEEHRISAEEVATGFTVMAQLKNDPAKFLETIKPYVEAAQRAVGELLPDDLRQKVDNGAIDEESARELARTRAAAAAATEGQKRAETQVADTTRATAAQQMGSAVSTWEIGIQSRDPDYPRKQEEVQDRALALMRVKGAPKTPEEAVALVKQAYQEVNRRLAARIPRDRRDNPQPSGSSAAADVRPEPKSLLDVVKMAAKGEIRATS